MSTENRRQFTRTRWTGQSTQRSAIPKASPVEGVETLRDGKTTNFVTVKAQLYDKLQADYGDLASFIDSGKLWYPEVPTMEDVDERYPTLAAKGKEVVFTTKINEYEKAMSRINTNYAKIFGTIKQVLDASTRDKVERAVGFSDAKTNSDPCALWVLITRVVGMQISTAGDLDDSRQTVKLLYQGEQMSTSESLLTFYQRFKLRYEHCLLIGVKDIPDEAGAARDFFSKLDQARFGAFYREKKNAVRREIDDWAESLLNAYEEVEMWEPPTASWRTTDQRAGRPAVFAATSQSAVNPQRDRSRMPCHQCGELGHWKNECPNSSARSNPARREPARMPRQAAQVATAARTRPRRTVNSGERRVMFSQTESASEDHNIFMMTTEGTKHNVFHSASVIQNDYEFIYDTGADTCVVRDPFLLTDVRHAPAEVAVTGLSGQGKCSAVGTLPAFGSCVVAEHCPVNIISGHVAERMHTVEYNPGVSYVVLVDNNIKLVFTKRENGFYICDIRKHMDALLRFHNSSQIRDERSAWTLSVHDREVHYTKREVRDAERARELQRALGYPSRQNMVDALRNGCIVNCPITVADVVRAETIFGPSVGTLKGKMTDPGPAKHSLVTVPKSSRRDLVMHIDVMHVLEVPMLISVFAPLNMVMSSELTVKRDAKLIAETVNAQVRKARANGFDVKIVYADGEGCIAGSEERLNAIGLDMRRVAKGAHVAIAERAIRVVKERARSVVAELVWKMPKCLAKWLVHYCVSRINALPRNSSSVGISAREEFRGSKLDYAQDLCLCFGDYVQAYRTPGAKNSMESRSIGAIALIPMENASRSWVFFNLISLRTFTASKWVLLPTPDIVIMRMKEIAEKGLTTKGEEGPPPLIDMRDVEADDALPMVDREPLREVALREVGNDVIIDDAAGDDIIVDEIADEESPMPDLVEDGDSDDEDEPYVPVGGARAAKETTDTAPPLLRRSPRNVHVVTGNMSYGKAQRLHGTKADEAILSELTQMITKKVFKVVPWSRARGHKVLRSHVFLKEKRDQEGALIKVKARLVAGGDGQDRSLYPVEKRTSPTVHTESIFCLLGLAAAEGLKVGSIDIEAAFLEPDLKKLILMLIDRQSSAILVAKFPELAEFLNSSGCLVVELLKALYGLVEAAQLWYLKLSTALTSFELQISLIDRCVFHGVLGGHKMYVCVHVDDIAVFSVDIEGAVCELERCLNGEFTKANVDMSNPLTFLGMRFTTSEDGIYVDMARFEEESCTSWGATSALAVPATADLFNDDDASPLLSAERAKTFHSGAAKLLFLAKRARPDILTAVNVCCGHVLAPTERDWKRLDRVFRYLYGTIGKGLRFTRNMPLSMVCYSDAAFACHAQYRSRTGVVVTVNGGVVATKSSAQTLTTKSTPESELVALSDGATIVLGCRQLFESIGVYVPTVPMMEDNQTTLEYIRHGGPIHARTRYIGVKLYFTKDHVESGELTMEFCKSGDMLADLMTKPVGGELYSSLRDQLVFDVPVLKSVGNG